jgi:hypothetical protein
MKPWPGPAQERASRDGHSSLGSEGVRDRAGS